MARFRRQSHAIWQCKYHVVWCPKYRYRVLKGEVKTQMEEVLRSLCEWKGVGIVEMNVQEDHVHMILEVPPKRSVSEVMGILKGKSAIKMFKSFAGLKKKPYWGNHFWSRGYCVSTIGLDEEKVRKYVKYQEDHEKREEAEQENFGLLERPDS
jgi:putative transposase